MVNLAFMFTLLSCGPTIGQNRDVTTLPLVEATSVESTASSPVAEGVLTETPTTVEISTSLESAVFNIFLFLRSHPGIQVWKYELPRQVSTVLHENLQPDKSFREHLEDVIPTSELAIYAEFHDEYPQDEVEIARFIDGLTIAITPNGERLAWVEGIGWYPDIFEYGFSQVVVTDINSNNQSVAAEYNFHLPLVKNTPIVVRPGLIRIISLSWSSGSRYLAITMDFNKGAYQHLGIYDLQTQKLTEVALGEGTSIPVWSNDSSLLAYSHAFPVAGDVSYRSSIEIIKVHSDSQIDTEFNVEYDIESFISGLSWSPDDTQIVAIASPGNLTDINTLITVDVDSRTIHNIVIEAIPPGLFSEPKWSPNGRYIGVNYRSEYDGFIDQLIVLDPELGQVQAIFQSDRPESSWEWLDDENVILVEGQVSTSMRVSLWNWESGKAESQPILLDDSESLINGGNAYISILGTSK